MSGIIINPYVYAAAGIDDIDNGFYMEFDGVDDYIRVPAFATSGTDWSISFWWKTTMTGGGRLMLDGSAVNIGGNWGNFQYVVAYPDSTLWNMYHSMSWNDGNWHQAIFTYNYTSGAWKMYIDGALAVSQVADAGRDIRNTTIFGAKYTAGSNFFDGNLDEIAYFAAELSADDVTEIYDATDFVTDKCADLSSMATPPIAWYRMGD